MRRLIPALALLLIAACSGSGDDETAASTAPGDESTVTTSTEAVSIGDGDTTTTTSLPADSTAPSTTSPARVSTTTSTTVTATTTTTTSGGISSTTTTAGRSPNTPPTVSIVGPSAGTRFAASYSEANGAFGAVVNLSAVVDDPESDDYTVEWFSSLQGFLGTGAGLSAFLTVEGDTSQPVLTARVTDATGAVTEVSVPIIVWIPSDE